MYGNIYELLPAFLVACGAIAVVSLLTAEPSEEILKEFEAVGNKKKDEKEEPRSVKVIDNFPVQG